jgi:hypothetical protein
MIAQHPQQRRLRIRVDRDLLAIDLQIERHGRFSPCLVVGPIDASDPPRVVARRAVEFPEPLGNDICDRSSQATAIVAIPGPCTRVNECIGVARVLIL